MQAEIQEHLRASLEATPCYPTLELEAITEAGNADYKGVLRIGQFEQPLVVLCLFGGTPSRITRAIDKAKRSAAAHDAVPVIAAPYITEEQMGRLAKMGISSADYSGNFLYTCDRFHLMKVGMPNRFPSKRTVGNVYSGVSALVGWALLKERKFDSVNALHSFILNNGGEIAQGTVSKVLKRLTLDGLVDRSEGIKLTSYQEAYAKLLRSIQPNLASRRMGITGPGFDQALVAAARKEGIKMAEHLEGRPRDQEGRGLRTIYVERFGDWMTHLPFENSITGANLEMIESSEPSAFFPLEPGDPIPRVRRKLDLIIPSDDGTSLITFKTVRRPESE